MNKYSQNKYHLFPPLYLPVEVSANIFIVFYCFLSRNG